MKTTIRDQFNSISFTCKRVLNVILNSPSHRFYYPGTQNMYYIYSTSNEEKCMRAEHESGILTTTLLLSDYLSHICIKSNYNQSSLLCPGVVWEVWNYFLIDEEIWPKLLSRTLVTARSTSRGSRRLCRDNLPPEYQLEKLPLWATTLIDENNYTWSKSFPGKREWSYEVV